MDKEKYTICLQIKKNKRFSKILNFKKKIQKDNHLFLMKLDDYKENGIYSKDLKRRFIDQENYIKLFKTLKTMEVSIKKLKFMHEISEIEKKEIEEHISNKSFSELIEQLILQQCQGNDVKSLKLFYTPLSSFFEFYTRGLLIIESKNLIEIEQNITEYDFFNLITGSYKGDKNVEN